MNLVRTGSQARCNRVETDLQFFQQGHELGCLEAHSGVGQKEIDHLATPKILAEFLLFFGFEQTGEFRSRGPLGDGAEQLVIRSGDDAIPEQRLAQGDLLLVGVDHRFAAAGTEGLDQIFSTCAGLFCGSTASESPGS